MEQLQELLERYRAGERGELTVQLLELLETRDEAIRDVLRREFNAPLPAGKAPLDQQEADRILRQLHDKILHTASLPEHKKVFASFSIRPVLWAAAVLLLTCASFMVMRFITREDNGSLREISTPVASVKTRTVKNTGDRPMEWLLPDSSFVRLHPGSELYYKEGFDKTYRSLNLKGKAFFRVAKDVKRPFTVYADSVATTALGTEFSVSTLTGPHKVRVKLCSGAVVIRSLSGEMTGKEVYLRPGEECTVNRYTKEAVVKWSDRRNNTDGNSRLAGSAGGSLMEFYKEPLPKVMDRLNKHFGVQIKYTGTSLNNLSFTGSFKPGDSLQMILTIICRTNDLSFEREGTQVTIRRQH